MVQPPKIISATVTTMYKTVQRKYPGWWNIQRDDQTAESSVNLQNVRWKFSEMPTDKDQDDEFQQSTNSEHNDSDDTYNVEDLDIQESDYGDEVHNEGFELENAPQSLHLNMPFEKVVNLDNVLPLTSTPTPDPQTRPRVSAVRPRGMLPMEIEEPSPSGSSSTPSRIKQAIQKRATKFKELFPGSKDSSGSQ